MIELACLRWLRFENKCVIVLNERTPVYGHGNPDVLGVTEARFLKEIEVKRSMSDFRANALKFHVANREHCLDRWPRQFYYAVPLKLAEKVKQELPPWAGLLTVDETIVHLEVNAPINPHAKKLSVQRCVRLAKCMANQIACQASDLINERRLSRHHDCPNHLDSLYAGGWFFKDGTSSKPGDYQNFQI